MQIQLADFPDNGNPNLKAFATEKVERLGKFFDRIVDVDVYLKKGNDPAGEATAEMRVNIPTTRLFCTEHAESYEEALDKASKAMERQLIRWKEKHSSHG